MKKHLIAITAALLFLMPNINYGQAPSLGTVANYVLFTTNGAMTNSGIPHLTHLTGNVGSNLPGAISGFGNVDGQMHDFDVSTAQCVADLGTLYTQISTATPTFFPSTTLGNGDTLIAGVYFLSAAATLGNTLILNAHGNANAVFIFQIQGSLSVAALSKVKLINGALACNVFWDVEGLVSVATGATLCGNIVAHNAAINLNALDTLEGRALSINGAVTLNSLLAYMPIGCGSAILVGPGAPALASASIFAVFSSIGAVTATPITFINGDVGSNSTTTTGFNPLDVAGTIHTPPDAATASCASDLTIIYNYLNGLAPDILLLDPPNFGFGLVLTPHTYLLGAATTFTDTIYLNAEGDANAVFVIQVNGALITSTHSNVKLINGTKAKNVYWLVNGAVHIFDNSLFNGQIIAAGAITLNPGDTLDGRALTINGAVAINGSFVNNNPGPCSASPITGSNQVCIGSSTSLADIDTGGKWYSSNIAITTIDSLTGVVTGVALGMDTITYISSIACVSSITISVNPSVLPITGPSSVCIGSTVTLNDASTGGKWSSSDTLQATIDSVTGHVNGLLTGTPTISYILPTGCMVTRIESVNTIPVAGTITGLNIVCMGSTLVLNDINTGGSWSSSNTKATVIAGTVNPVSAGIDTIRYIVITSCGTDTATKTITINPLPNAGTITGGNTACIGSILVLNDITLGGTWGSSNSNATVLAGTVNPVTVGIDTIRYIVTNSCGSDTATNIITIGTLPNAGTISGGNTVCIGSTLVLTDLTNGGIWISSNSNATVSAGTVNPASAGIDTIGYVLINSCGSDTAKKIITINPLLNAGTITGGNTVCIGSTLVLNDITLGGTWGSSNSNATVSAGTVNPVSIGIDTILYTVANICGSNTATKIITINILPNAGSISGATYVCVSFSITLNDAATGGVWSSTNTNAIASDSVVTGVNVGIDTINYSITNFCGTNTATKIISINPLPNAGIILGTSNICLGTSVTLTDTASGGTWSCSNSNATISGGVVTGITLGVDTVSYVDTNLCGTALTQKIITVNPLPSAGTISGGNSICMGSTLLLNDATTGGIWSSSNTDATVISGTVNPITSGIDTIRYMFTNSCGTDTAIKIIVINPLPDAGLITGASTVCLNTTITLTDFSTGGIWTASNTNAAVSDSIVTALIVGVDTISYTVINVCGTNIATKIITVNPLPNAGIIAGLSSVCIGNTITLTDTVTGGVWSCSNTLAIISSGVVSGIIAGIDTIRYVDTNMCGTDIAQKAITVNPLPNAGSISGGTTVCMGSQLTLTDTTTGGIWESSNSFATVSGGIVTGITAGITTIRYLVTNVCGTDTANKTISVYSLPFVPVITTQSPSSVCSGTLFQNFGTSTPPPVGITYSWSATNATVWATSDNGQYALISFPNSGLANVTLADNFGGTGCSNKDMFAVNVATTIAQTPTVLYFQYHFVCIPANEDFYQWGYDDKTTLDSTILTGEINQDYLNTAPDFTNKYYWVMTGSGGCTQKTYLTVPTMIHEVNSNVVTMNIFPNPANGLINVEINSTDGNDEELEVISMAGQKLTAIQTTNHKVGIDVANFPAGFYMINCYRNGIKISNARFIKN